MNRRDCAAWSAAFAGRLFQLELRESAGLVRAARDEMAEQQEFFRGLDRSDDADDLRAAEIIEDESRSSPDLERLGVAFFRNFAPARVLERQGPVNVERQVDEGPVVILLHVLHVED